MSLMEDNSNDVDDPWEAEMGSHDVWDFEKSDDDSSITHKDTSPDIEIPAPDTVEMSRQNLENGHLKWHCCVYMKTLSKIPGGLSILQKTIKEYTDIPPIDCCYECEILRLRIKLKEYEEKLTNFKIPFEKSD